MYDGKPVPKVIDFGIAKATDQQLTQHTMFTQFGADGRHAGVHEPGAGGDERLGVDTRSDIYSLGVLLYELLTGTTPLEKALRAAALRRDAAALSARRSRRGQARALAAPRAASIAAARKTEPGSCEAGTRRSGLDRDEVPGEAARPAL